MEDYDWDKRKLENIQLSKQITKYLMTKLEGSGKKQIYTTSKKLSRQFNVSTHRIGFILRRLLTNGFQGLFIYSDTGRHKVWCYKGDN